MKQTPNRFKTIFINKLLFKVSFPVCHPKSVEVPLSDSYMFVLYFTTTVYERCRSVVVSTSACHAAGRGSIPGPGALLGVKTWLSILEIVYLWVFWMIH